MIVIWVESLSSFRTWNASFRPSDFRSFCLTANYSKVQPLYMSILSFLVASKIFSLFCFCSVLTLWHGGGGGVLFCSYLLLKRLLILFTKGLGNFLLPFVEIMVYAFTMVLFFESDNSNVKCFSGVARISLPMFLFFSHISQTLLGDPAILLHLPAPTLWFSYDPFYWFFFFFAFLASFHFGIFSAIIYFYWILFLYLGMHSTFHWALHFCSPGIYSYPISVVWA